MSGYVFDPDEVRAVHAQWTQLLTEVIKDSEEALKIINIRAPGIEPASETMAISGQDSGKEFERHNESVRDYVQSFVDNLSSAGSGYLQEEEIAGHRFLPRS